MEQGRVLLVFNALQLYVGVFGTTVVCLFVVCYQSATNVLWLSVKS